MGSIYDGAFRTILNDCRKLIIPVINEIFGENYSGEEEIEFFPNEHFAERQDEEVRERITDRNFRIMGRETKKYHLECESGFPDGRITIRLFEYDAQIALDEGETTGETLTVTFPNTAVLHLRVRKNSPDRMEYVIVTPGGTVRYKIPVMKVQSYTLKEIFRKRLLILIPFYIFSHEARLREYNDDRRRLGELEAEYRWILEKLECLEEEGIIGAFDRRTIIELSREVIKELTHNYENVQKGMGDIMGGALMETEARTILNQGISQGISQGIGQGKMLGMEEARKSTARRMLKKGKLGIEEIAEYSGLTVEEAKQLAAEENGGKE